MHPATKRIIDLAIEWADEPARILDMGAGNGVIAKALKAHFPNSQVEATDINAEQYDRSGEEEIVWHSSGDLFEKIVGEFDLIVCTLPNQPSDEVAHLDEEERLKCDGGPTGFELIERFTKELKNHLKKGGSVIISITPNQVDLLPGWTILQHNGINQFAARER